MYCGFMTLYWFLMQPIHFVTNSIKRGNVKLAAKQSHLAIILINVEAHRPAWRWLPLSVVVFLDLKSPLPLPFLCLTTCLVCHSPPPCPGLIADYDLVSSWLHRLNLVKVMKYSHFSGHTVLSFEPTNNKLEPIIDIWYTIW